MQKMRYEVDPYNRLVIASSGKKSDLPKFRKVLDGRFATDSKNNLIYHIKAPLSIDEKMPHQVKLKGEWTLTDNHNLCLTLVKSGRQTFGDRIILDGEIVKVDENSLSFAVTTSSGDTARTYVLDLVGWWKADENNRLTFRVKKDKGESDILTFGGSWNIGKNYQIIYEYEKADLIRKKRREHTITFKGFWDIKDRYRISYLLAGSSESAFDFEASAGVFKKDMIKYEIGVGLKDSRQKEIRTLKLFGRWNVRKGAGLIFEIRYENNKTKEIIFGAEADLTQKDTVSLRLKSAAGGKDMGVTLELARSILKGEGQVFLRALASQKESAIYVGAARRW